MTTSIALGLELKRVVATMTEKAVWADIIQYFHCRPLRFALVTEVFFLLLGGNFGSLYAFADCVHSPFDGIDRILVVDVVPRAVAWSWIAFSQFCSRMSVKSQSTRRLLWRQSKHTLSEACVLAAFRKSCADLLC
jgi:hypothetical protein